MRTVDRSSGSMVPVMKRNRYGYGWTIELSLIERATRILGIAHPVNVCVTGRMDMTTLGVFDGEKNGAWRIYLDRFLTTRQASLTLWHELVHVAQAERAGGMRELDRRLDRERLAARLDGPRKRKFFRLRAYQNLPLEREAEERAQQLHKRLPLAKATEGTRTWWPW